MKDLDYLIEKMDHRMTALRDYIDRDYTANLTGLNESLREVKYWKEFIERELLKEGE